MLAMLFPHANIAMDIIPAAIIRSHRLQNLYISSTVTQLRRIVVGINHIKRNDCVSILLETNRCADTGLSTKIKSKMAGKTTLLRSSTKIRCLHCVDSISTITQQKIKYITFASSAIK